MVVFVIPGTVDQGKDRRGQNLIRMSIMSHAVDQALMYNGLHPSSLLSQRQTDLYDTDLGGNGKVHYDRSVRS